MFRFVEDYCVPMYSVQPLESLDLWRDRELLFLVKFYESSHFGHILSKVTPIQSSLWPARTPLNGD